MGLGSSSVDFIRSFFKTTEYNRPPFIPVVGHAGLMSQAPYFGYGLPSGAVQGLTDYLRLDSDLVARYVDYEDQDDSPLISSALDVYSDDSTQTDTQHGKTIWIEAEDEDIRKELDNLLHKRLRIEESVWSWVRTLCKYGNNYLESVVKDKAGVIAVNILPPPTMRRIEVPKQVGNLDPSRADEVEDTLGYIYDPRGAFKISTNQFIKDLRLRSGMDQSSEYKADPTQMHGCAVFENWEVSHMRLMGKNPMNIYGYGVGEPARWIFKRLVLLEDSIIMHRLTRAPSRYAFYVDVSQIPPQETSAYLNRVKQSLKKQNFVNPNTNKLDMRFHQMSSMDDFFLPVRDGKESTRVESLAGPVYDHIEDIKFFENKLFAALKVPKPFLTYEESTAKTNLSAEDARFARTVLRIQREVRNGIKKICRVHLSAKGINPDAVEFDVTMTIPSAIFELAQLEIRKAELELADAFGTWAPQYWIKNHILGFSDEQIQEMERMKALEDEGQSVSQENRGAASGAIEKALAGRGERRSPSEREIPKRVVPTGRPTPPETASRKVSNDKLLMNGVKRNTESIMERIEELRTRSKDFDRKWGEITGFMKDFQSALGRRR